SPDGSVGCCGCSGGRLGSTTGGSPSRGMVGTPGAPGMTAGCGQVRQPGPVVAQVVSRWPACWYWPWAVDQPNTPPARTAKQVRPPRRMRDDIRTLLVQSGGGAGRLRGEGRRLPGTEFIPVG